MKKMQEDQWRAAVDLLLECISRTQTLVAQVVNDPTNRGHMLEMANQFDINKMIVSTIKTRIGIKS